MVRKLYTAPVYYLLRYVRGGETRFVIMDGWSLMHARLSAACLELGRFVDGCPIASARAARVLPHAVGRPLTRQEARALLDVPKKPPAPSVQRRFK
jgi:hypothetical protein